MVPNPIPVRGVGAAEAVTLAQRRGSCRFSLFCESVVTRPTELATSGAERELQIIIFLPFSLCHIFPPCPALSCPSLWLISAAVPSAVLAPTLPFTQSASLLLISLFFHWTFFTSVFLTTGAAAVRGIPSSAFEIA